ncbi:T9SS type A sorting domain-containing protein [bacterium]|nr:T9SS type A sorting domain-containing protein [bacterium]
MKTIRSIGLTLIVFAFVGLCTAGGKEINLSGELDGGNRTLRELAWSHEGNMLAVTASDGIWIATFNGLLPYRLVMSDSVSEELTYTSFSHDDREIIFTRSNTMDVEKPGRFVIESVSIESGEHTIVEENATDGRWSSDGGYFMYFEEIMYGVWALKLYDRENETKRVVLSTEELGGYWYFSVPYCISPDNSHVVINVEETGPNNPVNLYRVDLVSGDREPVTAFTEGYTDSPMYSPDGSWLLFTHTSIIPEEEDGKKYRPELMVYSVESREYYPLVGNDGTFHGIEPAWAPDGKSVWYILLLENEGNVLSKVCSIDFDPGALMNPDGAGSMKPHEFTLIGNYPNPFNGVTTVLFSADIAVDTRLEVYNILGQKIRVLLSDTVDPGIHRIAWNGVDDTGRAIVSGQYVLKLTAGGNAATHKMLYVK